MVVNTGMIICKGRDKEIRGRNAPFRYLEGKFQRNPGSEQGDQSDQSMDQITLVPLL